MKSVTFLQMAVKKCVNPKNKRSDFYKAWLQVCCDGDDEDRVGPSLFQQVKKFEKNCSRETVKEAPFSTSGEAARVTGPEIEDQKM